MLGNGILQSTTTSGTGNLTLASVTGYSTFANYANSRARRFVYTIREDASGVPGAPIESGIGYLSGGALVREHVVATWSAGVPTFVNSPSGQVSLGVGTTKWIVNSIPDWASVLNPPSAPVAQNGTANKRLVLPDNCAPPTTAAFAFSANTLWAWPVRIPHRGNFNAFAMRTSATGTTVDFALYEMLGNGLPGDLIVSSLGVASAAGMIYGTFTSQALMPGWYVMAANSSGSTNAYSQTPIDSCYGRSDTATAETTAWKSHTQGTVPNPFGTPSGIGYTFSAVVPAIALRHV